MKIFAKSEHKEHTLDIEETGIGYQIINANGTLYNAELCDIDHQRYSILINNESFIVNCSQENGKYTVIIRGKQFEIEVDDEKSKMWKQIIAQKEGESGSGKIKSQMPGLVVKYLVSEGDDVQKGDGLIILEAMKMENIIKSPIAGKVVSINVTAGTAVDKGQHLLTIE